MRKKNDLQFLLPEKRKKNGMKDFIIPVLHIMIAYLLYVIIV
jgi:hypothetical protein